ncbi:hypothetical protein GCM10022216_15650 [Sphingobacterium kyonggiense]|uniref:Uncharacterized protein n=1 Tax=Sphingobacterium kyonggiense TaxID=714075 RepID=A0ABP7YMN2_9SPHI
MSLFSAVTILIVLIVIFTIVKTLKPTNSKKPGLKFNEEDFKTKNNNKVILIKGPINNDVRIACEEFCQEFNKHKFQVIINLIRINPETNLLIFPYDISFKHFCYLINYLRFVNKLSNKGTITGWLSNPDCEYWLNEHLIDQNIMIYIPKEEGPGNYVYACTGKNDTFQLKFTLDKDNYSTMDNLQLYQKCPIKIEDYSYGKGNLIV